MIALADTSPEVNVEAAEYRRLLGRPRAVELAERAREWYARRVDGCQFRPV